MPEDKGEQDPSGQKHRHTTGREPGVSEGLREGGGQGNGKEERLGQLKTERAGFYGVFPQARHRFYVVPTKAL